MSTTGPVDGDPPAEGDLLPPYTAILVVDATGYSTRASAQQTELNEAVERVLEAAFAGAGLGGAWRDRRFAAHTGDGYIVGLPAEILPRLVHPLLSELQAQLHGWNRGLRTGQPRLRLRASIHVGPLPHRGRSSDGVGRPMTDTHRLLDSDAARRALAEAHEEVTFLAAIVSRRVFEDVVEGGYSGLHPSQFTKVVAMAKGFVEVAYVHVPKPSRRPDAADQDAPSGAAERGMPAPAERDVAPDDSSGISQRGRTNVVGAAALGRDSRAIQLGDIRVGPAPTGDARRVRALLDDLRERIEERAGELSDPDRARRALRSLDDEVEATDADPNVVRRMLERLTSAVRSVSALSSTVADLATAMEPWLD
jgi:hypothetical protein